MTSEIDVTQFGAVGDGTTDVHLAVSKALSALIVVPAWDGLIVGGGTIRFPTPPPSPNPLASSTSFYRLMTPIVVPTDRNVAFVGASCLSAAVALDAGVPDPYAFVVPSGDATVTFERLTIRRGGVRIEGPRTAPVVFRDCAFTASPQWCITADDHQAVENVSIIRCLFMETGPTVLSGWDAGVIHMGANASRWRVEHSVFLSIAGDAIRIGGTGCRVDRCRFETLRPDAAIETSERFRSVGVHVASTSGGGVQVSRCRFGVEGQAPRDFVVVGAPKSHAARDKVRGVRFKQCLFRGIESNLPQKYHGLSGRGALRLDGAARGVQLTDCSAWDYGYFVVEDPSAVVPPLPSGVSDASNLSPVPVGEPLFPTETSSSQPATQAARRDNSLVDVYFVNDRTWTKGPMRTFSDDGAGFELFGIRLRDENGRAVPKWRRGGNLLAADTGKLPTSTSSWNLAHVKVTETEDPFGGTLAWLTWPTDSGSSLSQTLMSTTLAQFDGGPAVFSVWLRASQGEARARLEIRPLGLRPSSSGQLYLDRVWRRYSVTGRADGSSVDVVIRPGPHDELPPLGTEKNPLGIQELRPWLIEVAGPQMEPGTSPTAYTPALWPPHAPRPDRSLLLGGRVLGRLTSEVLMPDQWSHRPGDRLFVPGTKPTDPLWIAYDGKVWRKMTDS